MIVKLYSFEQRNAWKFSSYEAPTFFIRNLFTYSLRNKSYFRTPPSFVGNSHFEPPSAASYSHWGSYIFLSPYRQVPGWYFKWCHNFYETQVKNL